MARSGVCARACTPTTDALVRHPAGAAHLVGPSPFVPKKGLYPVTWSAPFIPPGQFHAGKRGCGCRCGITVGARRTQAAVGARLRRRVRPATIADADAMSLPVAWLAKARNRKQTAVHRITPLEPSARPERSEPSPQQQLAGLNDNDTRVLLRGSCALLPCAPLWITDTHP